MRNSRIGWLLTAIVAISLVLSACVATPPACKPGFEYVPAKAGQESYCRELAHQGSAAPAAPAATEPAAKATGVPAEEPASVGGSPDNPCGLVVSDPTRLWVSTDQPVWCKVLDGDYSPVDVQFKNAVLTTMWFGFDGAGNPTPVYLAVKHDGDHVEKLVAGTFRPFDVWGEENSVLEWGRQYEAQYHEVGSKNPACLKDATQDDLSLTSLCPDFKK